MPSDSAEVHKIRSKQSKSSATVPPVSSRGKPNEESERSTEEVPTSRKTSSTLIKYTSDETKTSEDARVDATVNDIMGAIKSLNVKVGELGKHHLSITQFAFEDKSLRNDVSKMRKAENIHEMADSSELFSENFSTRVLSFISRRQSFLLTGARSFSRPELQNKAPRKLLIGLMLRKEDVLFWSSNVVSLVYVGYISL